MILVLASLFALLAALHLVTIGLCLWRLRRRFPPASGDRPLVSLLRPVCGLDPLDAETLGSSFALAYPNYELLFCAAREDDAAIPLLRQLIAANPHLDAQILIGDSHATGNPKLNNLIKGWKMARGDLVVMADANLLLPPDYLDQILSRTGPNVGLVSAPPLGTRADGIWGAVEGAFLNTHQARWQLAADALGQGFAQGKTLAWPREVLERGGGIEILGNQLAEDVAATRLVRAQGLSVRLTPSLFEQPIGRRTLTSLWTRQLRWSRVRRAGFPALFVAEILLGPILPAILLITVAGAAWLPLFLLVWYGAEWALARLAAWPSAPRDLLAMILRDLSMPALWVATWARRGFEWRGNAMAPERGIQAEDAS